MSKSAPDNFKGSGLSKGAYQMSQKYGANAQDVYGAKNLKSSMTGGVAAPNLKDPFGYSASLKQQYQLPELEQGAEKATANINKFNEQTKKELGLIANTKKNPVALPVQGLQASNYANQRAQIGTALSDELAQINQRLGYAQQGYNQDISFYGNQQSNAIQQSQFAQTMALNYAKDFPFGVPGQTGTNGTSGTGIPGWGTNAQTETTPATGTAAATAPATSQNQSQISQATPQVTQTPQVAQGTQPSQGTPAWQQATGQQQNPLQQATQPQQQATPAQAALAPFVTSQTYDQAIASGKDPSVLQNLPTPIAQQVKAIAEYRQAPVARVSAMGAQIMQMAEAYNPQYDATQYQARQKMVNSVSSGNIANVVTSANTLVSHLNRLQASFNQLGNTNFSWANEAKNYLGTKMGNTQLQTNVTAVQTEANAVADEMAKIYKNSTTSGAAPSTEEIDTWKAQFNENMTPSEFQSAINTGIALMTDKLNQVNTQYQDAMQTPQNMPFFKPETTQILQNNFPEVAKEFGLTDYGMPTQGGQTQEGQQNQGSQNQSVPAGSTVTYNGQQYNVDDQGNMAPMQ